MTTRAVVGSSMVITMVFTFLRLRLNDGLKAELKHLTPNIQHRGQGENSQVRVLA
jgi:hypothetical protein